ncbi:hypothetical protein [Aureimonas altamirensis]|uniref:Uncharacterized protein n=1 Tax=Aureimonas altamirensis TaxID=370622 RepID=A0A0P0YY29_9HYPH|nr:hypothetical protein [Aureimonas altamirensis]BAT26291.1 hypothetical protein [Aureimonas altamirensis]
MKSRATAQPISAFEKETPDDLSQIVSVGNAIGPIGLYRLSHPIIECLMADKTPDSLRRLKIDYGALQGQAAEVNNTGIIRRSAQLKHGYTWARKIIIGL